MIHDDPKYTCDLEVLCTFRTLTRIPFGTPPSALTRKVSNCRCWCDSNPYHNPTSTCSPLLSTQILPHLNLTLETINAYQIFQSLLNIARKCKRMKGGKFTNCPASFNLCRATQQTSSVEGGNKCRQIHQADFPNPAMKSSHTRGRVQVHSSSKSGTAKGKGTPKIRTPNIISSIIQTSWGALSARVMHVFRLFHSHKELQMISKSELKPPASSANAVSFNVISKWRRTSSAV